LVAAVDIFQKAEPPATNNVKALAASARKKTTRRLAALATRLLRSTINALRVQRSILESQPGVARFNPRGLQLEDLEEHMDTLTPDAIASTALQRVQWGNGHCGRALARLAEEKKKERAAEEKKTFSDTYMELATAIFGDELEALREQSDVEWTAAEVASLADFLRGASYDPHMVELADELQRAKTQKK
jgi:hypothetical protein